MAAEFDLGLATPQDIEGIPDLQEHNLPHRGGMLSDAMSRARIEAALNDMPVIVARRDGRVVGYLLAGSRESKAGVPIMQAMLRAYPGSPDAYMYGPICVAESKRGQGLAAAMFAALRARIPDREAITFIRSDNAVSLRVHRKLGMRPVAEFTH